MIDTIAVRAWRIAPEDAALVFLREGRELDRFPQRGLS